MIFRSGCRCTPSPVAADSIRHRRRFSSVMEPTGAGQFSRNTSAKPPACSTGITPASMYGSVRRLSLVVTPLLPRTGLSVLYDAGGSGLLQRLEPLRTSPETLLPAAAQKLSNYIRTRLAETDYPRYRSRGWTIGSGMVESSAKQLVGLRLKGPGMHWSRAGATAVTALRCAHLNGHWHQTWQNLTLTG